MGNCFEYSKSRKSDNKKENKSRNTQPKNYEMKDKEKIGKNIEANNDLNIFNQDNIKNNENILRNVKTDNMEVKYTKKELDFPKVNKVIDKMSDSFHLLHEYCDRSKSKEEDIAIKNNFESNKILTNNIDNNPINIKEQKNEKDGLNKIQHNHYSDILKNENSNIKKDIIKENKNTNTVSKNNSGDINITNIDQIKGENKIDDNYKLNKNNSIGKNESEGVANKYIKDSSKINTTGFTIETSIELNKKVNNIKDNDEPNKLSKNELTENSTINNINNYEKFKTKKQIYLICPNCKKYIINIKSIEYLIKKKEFLVTYKCFCSKNQQKYFYEILSEKINNYCELHKYELNQFCEICNILLCVKCKETHNRHLIKEIINRDVISDEIIIQVQEKKVEFPGIDIINDIYNFYREEKNKDKNFDINLTSNNKKKETIISMNYIDEEKCQLKRNKSLLKYRNTKTLKGFDKIILSLIKLKSDLIATGIDDGTVKILDITKKDDNYLIINKYSVGSVLCLLEFEPNKLLGGTRENAILLWDLNDKKKEEYIYSFYKHGLWVNCLAKCDENHFASASNDRRIMIWNYKNKKLEQILERHEGQISDMIMLKNGYLCSASVDNNVLIWDWKKRNCISFFKPHRKYTKCICELNNKYLLTGSEDNTIGIWDEKYNNIKYLKGHTYPVRTLCQIDDNHFASGSFDNKIKIWDLNKYECIQTLEGHQSNVICVIKYNDDILISCSSDKTIRIWEKD